MACGGTNDPRHRTRPETEPVRSVGFTGALASGRLHADFLYRDGACFRICALSVQPDGHDDKLCRHGAGRFIRHARYRPGSRRKHRDCKPYSADARPFGRHDNTVSRYFLIYQTKRCGSDISRSRFSRSFTSGPYSRLVNGRIYFGCLACKQRRKTAEISRPLRSAR